MADFLKNGGAVAYGTVPADAVPAPQEPVAVPVPPAPAK